MANPEHVEILKSGVEKWNAWKWINWDVRPDLSKSDLIGTDLAGVDLTGTDLRRADLTMTNLRTANLEGADLTGADLSGTKLRDANMRGTYLYGTTIRQTELTGANLGGACFCGTVVTTCYTLHLALDLDFVRHSESSSLDHHTLRACSHSLPRVFLKGVGYSDEEILAFRELYGKALEFYSCFISHAESDDEFVEKLRQDLLTANVSCWHYRYDTTVGNPMTLEINAAIQTKDKTVLVCSEFALKRENVVKEIIEAIRLEDVTMKRKLFPIRIDEYLFSQELKQTEAKNVRDGIWEKEWVDRVREIVVGDFRDWKHHDKYKPEFERVLKALRAKQGIG